MPIWLVPAQSISLTSLSGLAPVHRFSKDKWGWGPLGVYFVRQGLAIQSSHASMLTPALWKSIWSPYRLPNV